MTKFDIIYRGKHSVEAYAQLMNAMPVAMIVTPKDFKVGRVDSNLRFLSFHSFDSRVDAMRCFVAQCQYWIDN